MNVQNYFKIYVIVITSTVFWEIHDILSFKDFYLLNKFSIKWKQFLKQEKIT